MNVKKRVVISIVFVLVLVSLFLVSCKGNDKDTDEIWINTDEVVAIDEAYQEKTSEDEKKSRGWQAYLDETTGLFGYKDVEGNVVIEPAYIEAEHFYGGRGVVRVPHQEGKELIGMLMDGPFGLVDPNGRIVVEPKGMIFRVDDWLYLESKPVDFWYGYGDRGYSVVKYTLINENGEQVGDEGYFYVDKLEPNLYLVNNGSESYFIKENGSKWEKLPVFDFSAEAQLGGGNIYVTANDDLEHRIKYKVDKVSGEMASMQEATVFNENLNYYTAINSPFIGTTYFYPVFESENKVLENRLNDEIKIIMEGYGLGKIQSVGYGQEAVTEDKKLIEAIEMTVSTDYHMTIVAGIINIDVIGYWYGLGAAHPNMSSMSHYLDLETGEAYNLGDLFSENTEWQKAIAIEADRYFLEDENMYLYFEKTAPLEERLEFFMKDTYDAYLSETGFSFYYQQYEIAPYAAGLPIFEVPFEALAPYYNKESSFYSKLGLVDKLIDVEGNLIENEEAVSLTELETEDIEWLQESLKIAGYYVPLDGSVGPKTIEMLKAFQGSQRIQETGLYDVDTQAALILIRELTIAPGLGTNKVLINKDYFLPRDYIPKDLREVNVRKNKSIELSEEAANQTESMFQAAENDGILLYLASGYRSYDYQEGLFKTRVANHGFEAAEKVVALPGESEHQTGLAIDITTAAMNYGLGQVFDQDPAFAWLEANCAEFGFILRYKKGMETQTGYIYEPWHYRYIGDVELARTIMSNSSILEDYLP